MNSNQYKLQNVWKNLAPHDQMEVAEFWIANGVITDPKVMQERFREIVFLIRGADNSLSGVCTVQAREVPRLDHNKFFYLRLFITEELREQRIAIDTLTQAQDYLEQKFKEGDSDECIGVVSQASSPILKKYKNEAIWPNSRMVFYGITEGGDPLRVYYFEGAEIK